jgi:hypothetical protein
MLVAPSTPIDTTKGRGRDGRALMRPARREFSKEPTKEPKGGAVEPVEDEREMDDRRRRREEVRKESCGGDAAPSSNGEGRCSHGGSSPTGEIASWLSESGDLRLGDAR